MKQFATSIFHAKTTQSPSNLLLIGAYSESTIILQSFVFHTLTKGISIMEYKVALRKADEGYAVWCPALPGCWSQGLTEAEALANIADAIKEYLLAVEEVNKNERLYTVQVV